MGTRTERRSIRLAVLSVATIGMLVALSASASTTERDAEVAALLARPLTADTAARIARLRQGRLHAMAHEVDAARARRRQAGLLPNPELKVDLRRPGGPRDSEQADVELELELGPLLTLPVRRAIADAELAGARHAADRSVVELMHEARISFYGVQAAELRWRKAVVALEIAVAARDAARALRAAGNATAVEVAIQEAASEAARVEVVSLELAYHDAREQLQQLLGLHGADSDWQAAPASELVVEDPPDLDDVESRALEANRELARMRMELASLSGSERLARIDGWLPGLAADVHAERDETQWEVGGGLRVSIPLFDRRQGETAALKADLRAAESRLRAAAVDLRSRARSARNHVISSHARARHWRDRVLPARRQVVEEMLLQHNAMQANVFDLLDAKRAEVEAERAASDALFEALVARCELNALLEGAPVRSRTQSDESRPIATDPTTGGH